MPRVVSIGSAGVDQAEDASNEARIKPWKRRKSLLVFSPKGPDCSEPIHSYHLGKTGTTIGKLVSAGENMKPIMHHTSPELSHGSERKLPAASIIPMCFLHHTAGQTKTLRRPPWPFPQTEA